MQKEKNKIIVECIENTINVSSLYTDRIYRWMNREGRNLFDIETVKAEFLKQTPNLSKESIDSEEKKDIISPIDTLIPSSVYKDIILFACLKEKNTSKGDKRFEQKLVWLKEILGLNACEFSILRLYAYIKRSHVLSCFLFDVFSSTKGYRHEFYIYDHPEVLMEREDHIGQALSPSGRLCRSGIISTDERNYGLCDPIYEMLKMPIKSQNDMKQILIGKRLKASIPLSDFSFLGTTPELLKTLLNNSIKKKQKGINILFYGKPGTGKTEFAKSLSEATGETLYSICDGENIDKEPTREERMASLKISDYVLSKSKGILLFDEAEDIFDVGFMHEKKSSKIFINRFLENNTHPIIWTTNNIHCMDKAYIRRFTYLVSFENPDKEIREKIWQKTASENGLSLSKEDIKDLSEGYQLPPAIINSVVKSTKLVNGGRVEIKNALSMYEKAMNCNYNVKKTNQEFSFNPKLLNTDTDMEQLANRLCQVKSLAFSLCLYGASGTGKSAYARYIAKKLGMEVVEKKASDLFDKYVGETEKNIAKSFSEAREKNALLIFDEADSLLQDRNFTQQSWETMQVNEMLTQMESHQLPFICTTNLMDKIDKASLRRFTFKIKYDYLTTEQVIQAFKHFFGREISQEKVQNLTFLTPGDFAVVKKKVRILGLDYKKEILDLLEEEMNAKGEKFNSFRMGFV